MPTNSTAFPSFLFHAPAVQVRTIAALLEHAKIDWTNKALIFCDCEAPVALVDRFRALGASTAVARQFGIPGTIMVEGAAPALMRAHRIAAELRLRAIEITPGSGDVFAAALTLATCRAEGAADSSRRRYDEGMRTAR